MISDKNVRTYELIFSLEMIYIGLRPFISGKKHLDLGPHIFSLTFWSLAKVCMILKLKSKLMLVFCYLLLLTPPLLSSALNF